jgi:hypothetical protein
MSNAASINRGKIFRPEALRMLGTGQASISVPWLRAAAKCCAAGLELLGPEWWCASGSRPTRMCPE